MAGAATQERAGKRTFRSQEALRGFIGEQFGLWLPDVVFTPGHSTPMEFVWEAHSRPWQDRAAWANRSGLKTLCASVIAALDYLLDDAHIRGRVLSGSEDQAKNLYGYWEDWCFGPLAGKLKGDPGRLLTRLANGDFEILAASQKRVRGAKVQRLYRDEIDEIDPEIYGASVGMLASIGDTPARTIDTSTWHHAHGPMGQLVEEADKRGIRLHKWNVWESVERCPDERHQRGRGCRVCPLAEPCIAKAREVCAGPAEVGIAARCGGLFAISDAIKQLRQWSQQQWEAEAECKRPVLEGLVYPQFDRIKHVRADLDFRRGLPIYRAIDWGLNNFVCLWIQVDKAGWVYVVDEYHGSDVPLARHAEHIKDKDEKVKVASTYCDPAGANRNDQTGMSDVQVFRDHGLPCTYAMDPWAREVRNGVQLIRAALQPAVGAPRLYVAGACKQTVKALESYRLRKVNNEWVDEPVKPQDVDHWVDALRYFYVNRLSGRQVGVKYLGFGAS